jgi:hypothetical protein
MLDLLGHNVWVLIPIAAIFAGVFKHNLRLKEKELDRARDREGESERRHAGETRQLEERLRVLERIVTDKGMDLSEEIERLRDKPAVRDMRADSGQAR